VIPESVFFFLIRQSILPQRKSHTRKPLVSCQFSGTCPQSQNFGENLVPILWLRQGQLWSQISWVLFGFCSAYKLVRKVI
jgi:hypothetical protein